MARRPFQSGRSTVTRRSKRPGRRSAWSSPSGRFVAAMTTTVWRVSKPSISTSNWFKVCSRSSLLLMLMPRWRPTASISSMKMILGDAFLAWSKRSRTRLAPTPTSTSTNSEPLIEKNGTPASPATARASNVLPVPGGPTSNTPRGILPPRRLNFCGVFKNSTTSTRSFFASSTPATTFADVAGVDEAKNDLVEVVEFLKTPQKFQRLGGKIPRGVLLVGPPGTGKTLLARAVAGEAGVPFFSMSGSEFVEVLVGVGASRVRDLFDQAKKAAPSIIFIDEIDAVGRQRGASINTNDEREQTLNQLLVEMDGFDTRQAVVVIAATNRPDGLDIALLRPGRFDRRVTVDRPDWNGRLAILKIHTRTVPLASDVDLVALARSTPGMVGADLANLVNEAALLAARRNLDRVTQRSFEEALDKILLGAERPIVLSEEDLNVIAYHESGHALTALLSQDADPVQKVTIVARGQALGVTMSVPLDDRYNYSKEYLLTQLVTLLGGRASEQVAIGRITTGAENDLQRVTAIARQMVTRWGMSERLGTISFSERSSPFAGINDVGAPSDYSETTAEAIDEEVE